MNFNIILPIISNTILAIALILGIFVGIKNEWKLSLAKLICVIGAGVGIYFLNPIIANALVSIPFIANIISQFAISSKTVLALTFAATYLVTFGLISLVIAIIRHHRNKVRLLKIQNGILVQRAKALDKQTEKVLKKEDKKAEKAKRKAIKRQHKVARLFGAILEFLAVVVTMFIVFLPIKFIVKEEIAKETQLPVEAIYEYTPFGQLDKVIDFSEFIIK